MVELILLVAYPIPMGIEKCKAREYEHGYALLNRRDADVPYESLAQVYYYRAIAAHQLGNKEATLRDTSYLLEGWFSYPVPIRYRMVALAMQNDAKTWQDKGLDPIARDMKSIGRRLDLGKAGPETQRQQKRVIVRLDEMIKRSENEKKDKQEGKEGASRNCPEREEKSERAAKQQGRPLDDSKIQGMTGKGVVDAKRMKEVADVWGKIPERERAAAMVELTRGLPPKYRDAIEGYFRELQNKSGAKHEP